VTREVGAFEALYPQAGIEVRWGASREAVQDLLSGRADLAVVTRELEPEEKSVVVKGGMGLDGYRFARDAVCAIVHPSNPVVQISAEDLRGVYLGRVRTWDELGGRRLPIEPVVPPANSDLMTAFVQRVMGGAAPTAPAFLATGGDSATLRRVLERPGSIGFVSMTSVGRGAKALEVSALRGLPAHRLDPETVYKGEYPLTRFFNLYVRSSGPKLANGFITFVTSRDGQRIVHEAGLVPTSVPVRFARRSPMLGTHRTGETTNSP